MFRSIEEEHEDGNRGQSQNDGKNGSYYRASRCQATRNVSVVVVSNKLMAEERLASIIVMMLLLAMTMQRRLQVKAAASFSSHLLVEARSDGTRLKCAKHNGLSERKRRHNISPRMSLLILLPIAQPMFVIDD